MSDLNSLTGVLEEETAPRRAQLGALGAFGGIAFLLAAVGIHGLLSFAVTNRTQEIGVRPGDYATFAAAAGLALLMTLAGSLLPTLRAVRVDPLTAIRSE